MRQSQEVFAIPSPRWWVVWALWTMFGLLSAAQTHFVWEFNGRPMSWTKALLAELSFAWLWAAMTPGVLWLLRRFPLGAAGWWRNIPVHLAVALVLSVAAKNLWDRTILPYVLPDRVPTTFPQQMSLALLALDYGVLQYGVIVMGGIARDHRRRAEQSRLRTSALEADLARAQLQALKMQLQPHFLFNTLNSIAELIHGSPQDAERMVIRLSEFLRLTLQQMGEPEVPLASEIDFVRRYLEIEQIRFDDRLQLSFDIDARSLDGRVPNLILQPLVENALKHGISKITGVGRLAIHTKAAAGRLYLRVKDNGPGISGIDTRMDVREGVGISNTRRRLQQVYGNDHIFSFTNGTEGGLEVTIEMPFVEARPAAAGRKA